MSKQIYCTDPSIHGCHGKYHGESIGAGGGNTKPQQECKCIKSRVYDPRKTYDFNCPVHDTPQQDTWEKRCDEVKKQLQMLGHESCVVCGIDPKRLKDFITEQKQLSEQQGYQRGYEEGALDATLGKYFEPKELELEKKKWKKLSEKKG